MWAVTTAHSSAEANQRSEFMKILCDWPKPTYGKIS